MKSLCLSRSLLAAAVAALGLLALPVAHADGTTTITVDPTNLNYGNFGAPTLTTGAGGTPYTLTTTTTASSFDIDLTPLASAAGEDFYNLYLSTGYEIGIGGSVIGISGDANGISNLFVPGGANGYSLAGTGITSTYDAANGGFDVTVPWTFLETDPSGLDYSEISSANDEVRVNLSQSFGYTVVGGAANYGANELGSGILPSASVPDTASTLALLALACGGLMAARKRLAGHSV